MRLVHNAIAVQDVPAPASPGSLETVGITIDRIEQLLVKHLYLGEATGLVLAERLRLPYTLLEPLVERMRAERLIEVRGAIGTGSAAYRYALTDLGRTTLAGLYTANRSELRRFRREMSDLLRELE